MSFRTARRISDRVVILEAIDGGDRITHNINRRSDIFEICQEDDLVVYVVLGYAMDGIDASKQLRENPPPIKAG